MAESKAEQLARVRLMAFDVGRDLWTLTDHDVTALQAVLADREALLAACREVVLAAVNVSDGCAICGCDLDATPPHYAGCAVDIAQAALTLAEGRP